MQLRLRNLAVCTSLAMIAALPGVAFSQSGVFDPEEGVNVIFLGAGSAPDFMGSDDNATVPAVVARIYFGDTRRYVQLLGTQLSLNLINSDEWAFGPQVVFRAKRDDDVDNKTVARMKEVDSEAEVGVFISRTWVLNPNDRRNKFALRADIGSGEGEFGTASANLWVPVSPRMVLNFGGGLAYGSNKWTDNYFGVKGTDVALYPSLGGREYKADGGLYDFRLNVGMIYHMTKNWHLGAGFRYSQLQGDAKDSPIVSQEGNKNQYIFGAAIGYAWQ